MKNLFDLYFIDVKVKDIKTNSKEVSKEDAFICIKGVNVDRHEYISEAVKNGASFIVVSKGKNYKVPYIKVKNPTKELNILTDYIYDDAKKINLIAVTGTDGKTTTASIIKDMLKDECGYIGTNGVIGKNYKATCDNTTPPLEKTYKYLDIFYKEGLTYAAIEASSEGMMHKRLGKLEFKRAILTNFTEDHLNVHKTLENYLKCKRKVFKQISKDGIAILNKDDEYYKKFKASCRCKTLSYGKSKYSRLRILSFKEYSNKTEIKYRYKGKVFEINSPLLGEFNVYNLSAAILTLLSMGYKVSTIRKKVYNIKVPFGRCEFLDYKTPYKIVIDYAHTTNGIKNILTYLNKIKRGKIITVSGSAGGREKEKRKWMGKALQELSDIVIYTEDDPRYEKPGEIINDLIDKSKTNYITIINREKAILKALSLAKNNDIVAILGKGRDNYMAIKDKKVFYSDIHVLDKYFNK